MSHEGIPTTEDSSPGVSRDGAGKEYDGGEFAHGIQPDDFDSDEPLTTDSEGRLVRGAHLKESPEPK